jgi:hypothetical protein
MDFLGGGFNPFCRKSGNFGFTWFHPPCEGYDMRSKTHDTPTSLAMFGINIYILILYPKWAGQVFQHVNPTQNRAYGNLSQIQISPSNILQVDLHPSLTYESKSAWLRQASMSKEPTHQTSLRMSSTKKMEQRSASKVP